MDVGDGAVELSLSSCSESESSVLESELSSELFARSSCGMRGNVSSDSKVVNYLLIWKRKFW